MVQIANSRSWWTFRFHVGVHQAIRQERVYTQEHLKLIHINVFILNTHITVAYLRFIKNIIFMLYKNKKKMKIIVLAFFTQKNLYTITDKMTSVRKSHILKSVKKSKTITCWKIWLLTKNLKQSYYHLHQQTVLLKIIYILQWL